MFMQSIVTILSRIEDFDSLEGVSEEEITKAETSLGLKFASDYREYLRAYGLASADGHEFTGIVSSSRLNVVDVTNKLKKIFVHYCDGFYVLEELAIDSIVIWQDADGNIYQASPQTEFVSIAESMAEYISIQ